MTKYYKAVRPNGRDFHSDTVQWDTIGEVVHHPRDYGDPYPGSGAATYLSVSVDKANCTGHKWPCRLLEVEPVEGHDVFTPDSEGLPSKRAATAWRSVRELAAHEVFGPQGEQVAALIDRARSLTADELSQVAAAGATGSAARYAARYAAWCAAWYAAWCAAWSATGSAARYAAWCAAWSATGSATGYAAGYAAGDGARDAALALLVRDLISTEHYDQLSGLWRKSVGEIHPDDVPLAA